MASPRRLIRRGFRWKSNESDRWIVYTYTENALFRLLADFGPQSLLRLGSEG
jgi:hypothetical protein